MFRWDELRVLCLGGAGQTGMEICRLLERKGVRTIFLHDLRMERAEQAVAELRAGRPDGEGATYVASAGDLFLPADQGGWEFVEVDGPCARACRDRAQPAAESAAQRADRLEGLLRHRLGPFTPAVVRDSLIWNLVRAYRPHVIVDSINTATVLGYRGDVIQGGRDVGEQSAPVFDLLRKDGGDPLPLPELPARMDALGAEKSRDAAHRLLEIWQTSLLMTAHLDVACMIRYVQCLHALFQGGAELAVPEFRRYVKVHTTGLGGMGFNLRYTHGDTGEPGLSTKLLGKVCAAGSFAQLLLSLAHTPGCDVRMVVPATLIGWETPEDSIIRGSVQTWSEHRLSREAGPLPLVDSEQLVRCDGSLSLREALEQAPGRVRETGRPLLIPYLSSGENNPYAAEDVEAISALGQMGCVTKEEVGRAVVECIEGDARYDVLTAIDSALLLPTQTAAVVRDRELRQARLRRERPGRRPLPSVSVGNLGPTTAKLLYELEILRATFETVERVVEEGDEMEMTLRACSYILEEEEGAVLRRQILSLGLPVFLRKGPDDSGLLLGRQLLFPDPGDAAVAEKRLDLDDPAFHDWLEKGWVDLTGPRMRWWHARFVEVRDSLLGDRAVSRNWFDPAGPFTAGQFLAYLHSVSGGQRKDYM